MYSLVKLVRQACAKSKQTGNRQTNETAVTPNMASESEFVVWVRQIFYCFFCGANVSSFAGRDIHIHCQLDRACTGQACTILSRRVFARAIRGDN